MISDVARSVVVAFQDGCSIHYVAACLVKIDQTRKTYNSFMDFETSSSVLISNCITLNYADTCYFTVACGSTHVPDVNNDTIATMLLIANVAAQRLEHCHIPI